MWWSYYVTGSLSFLLVSLFFLFSLAFFFVIKMDLAILISWEMASLGSSSLEIDFLFDWVSLSFGCVVLLISSCVFVFACEYMVGDVFLPRFSWLIFLFVMSMGFVIFIPNLVAILIGWDGLGLVSFLLVVYYQNYKSLAGGMITVLMNRVGDVMILLSIGLLCSEGAWHFFYVNDNLSLWVVCFFVLVAGMTKSAQVPFSSWLPAAMAAPTPVSALVHSSTLVTAGVFLLVRFFCFLESFVFFKPALLIISVITMLMAGISANMESDLKKIIALSTLSQLGVMMSSLGLGMWKLGLFHLYTHAMFKALLFLCAGSLIHRLQHGQDLRVVGMFWSRVPVVVSCLHVANLALCGAPFLAGFYSKDLILELSLFGFGNWGVLFMFFFATGLTVSYSVRLSYFVLWGSNNFYVLHNWGGEKLQEAFPMMVLVVGAVFGGSFFSWASFSGAPGLFLPSYEKFLSLFAVLAGGGVGWVFSSFYYVFDKKLSGGKAFFGMTFMWFLVHLSSQGVVKDGVKVGSFMLYQADRGWFEVFGGEGGYAGVKKGVLLVQLFLYNSILVYVGVMIFFAVSLFFVF